MVKVRHCGGEGEFYIGSSVLLTFVELVRSALSELPQYKTTYVELTFAHPIAIYKTCK